MTSSLLAFDKQFIDGEVSTIAGVDEVGYGAAAGPVVAGAAIFTFDSAMWVKDIDDSKQLSPRKRADLAKRIINRAVSVGIGIGSVREIENHGLGEAHKRALQRAVDALEVEPDLILADGNVNRKLKYWNVVKPTKWIVKGDTKSIAIAAASIVAKVFRDRLMLKLHEQHPGYGWETNVGYRTKAHYAGIEKLGLTQHHRTNSADMRQYLKT